MANTFQTPDDRNLLSPPQGLIRAAISQLQKRVAAVARSKLYNGIKLVVDKRNNMVGEDITKLLWLVVRYLWMKNPAKVSNKDTLEAEMHNFFNSFLELGSYKDFFQWILTCKIGKYTLSGSMYRCLTTACDSGCLALKQMFMCSTSEYFGTFNNCRLLNTDHKEAEHFQNAKREFFRYLGFSVNDYLSDVWKINIRVGATVRVGLFTSFFNALRIEGCDNVLTLKSDMARNHLFEMPSDHPSSGKSYHPILMFFVSFRLLNFGNVGLSHLYEPGVDLFDLYSVDLCAFMYLVLSEFYSSDGTKTSSGAQCTTPLMLFNYSLVAL